MAAAGGIISAAAFRGACCESADQPGSVRRRRGRRTARSVGASRAPASAEPSTARRDRANRPAILSAQWFPGLKQASEVIVLAGAAMGGCRTLRTSSSQSSTLGSVVSARASSNARSRQKASVGASGCKSSRTCRSAWRSLPESRRSLRVLISNGSRSGNHNESLDWGSLPRLPHP